MNKWGIGTRQETLIYRGEIVNPYSFPCLSFFLYTPIRIFGASFISKTHQENASWLFEFFLFLYICFIFLSMGFFLMLKHSVLHFFLSPFFKFENNKWKASYKIDRNFRTRYLRAYLFFANSNFGFFCASCFSARLWNFFYYH